MLLLLLLLLLSYSHLRTKLTESKRNINRISNLCGNRTQSEKSPGFDIWSSLSQGVQTRKPCKSSRNGIATGRTKHRTNICY